MTDVFVSYTSTDRERAREVSETLAALGYDVWWDQRIPVGSTWDQFIPTKVREAHCLVVLWSKNSIDSKYVREEVRLADTLGRLAPSVLDGTTPPFGFGQMEAAQLEDWHPGLLDHPEWLNLLHRVSELAGPPKTATSAVRDELARAFPRSPMSRLAAFVRRNTKVASGIALGFVAGAIVAAVAVALYLNDPTSFTRAEINSAIEVARWDATKDSGSVDAVSRFRRQYPLSRYTLEALALSARLERNVAAANRQRDELSRQLMEAQASTRSAMERSASLETQLAATESRLEVASTSTAHASANSERLAADLEASRRTLAELRASRQSPEPHAQRALEPRNVQAEARQGPARTIEVPRNCAGLSLLYQRDSVVTAVQRTGSVVTYTGNSLNGNGTYTYVAYRDLGLQVGDSFCGFQTRNGMRVAGGDE